jgi:ATP-dependent RNA helicase DDX52/ROK1
MDDLFRKLSAGTRFSQKDVASDKKRSKRQNAANLVKKPETKALPAELDFFGTKAEQEESCDKQVVKVSKKPMFKTLSEMHTWRKEKSIRVYGEDVPSPIKMFADLTRPEFGLPAEIVQTILQAGIKRPTPVQMQATTLLLAGRDAFVTAPTGSGKTLVFVLSILARLLKEKVEKGKIQALVVSPTRELAQQIRDEFRRFTPKNENDKSVVSSVLLNKAVLNSWQSKPPSNFPAILITTPKRLVHGVEKKIIDLSAVQQIIMDEADRLLDLGLMEQVDDILAACTFSDGPIQKVLFSATIPSGVEDLARTFMKDDVVRIVVGAINGATETIKQKLLYVGQEEGKLLAIRQMLTKGIEPPVIIFTETIERAQELFRELVMHGINVDIIHSSRTQAERERIITQFRAGRIWFLITTELLARGLDFPEVACVINYDFPQSTASYIHRIGRTGRAGKRGKAITLFTQRDAGYLRIVANVMRQSGCKVPEWIMQVPQLSRKRKHHVEKAQGAN